MDMEPQSQAWLEEEIEEEASLLGRQSRQHNNSSSNGTPNGGNEGNGAEKTEENGAEEAGENRAEETGQTEEIGHSQSVYFEAHQGKGSTAGVSGTEYNVTESSASETSSSEDEDSDLKKNEFEIQGIPSTETNRKNGKNSANEILCDLSPVTAQKLHDQNIENLEDLHNSAEGDAEIDLVEETDDEFTDLDVERVLQKQNTHDLYCPNCNSCITKRVILLRRRPRIRNIRHTLKPGNTLGTRDVSINGTPTPPADGHNNGGQLDVSPNGNPAAQVVDPNNDGQLNVSPNGTTAPPTLFRCLECFTLFIPTGNGSKLFQCFGGGDDNVNIQIAQNRAAPTKNWFLKFFSSDNTNPSIGDGNDVIIGESQPVEPQPVETQPVETHPVETKPAETHPVETKPVETHPVETKPVETHPVETRPVETRPVETRPVETHPVETKPAETHPVETHPVETKPVETRPVETRPVETHPVEKHTVETRAVETRAVETHAVETHTVETHAVETHTVQTQEVETHTFLTKPLLTQPVKTNWLFRIFSSDKTKPPIDHGHDVRIDIKPEPVQPKPLQTQPVETHPVETQQVETLQGETQPVETQPVHTLPVQIQPVPTLSVNPVEVRNWDILKSIVYGGLVESITSLGVVSSAAGAGATTLNILALALASVVGGLFIIADNLKELKNEQEDRYQQVLGRRQNFPRHAIVAVLSFLIFGLLPPVIYGFSFRESDDTDLKIAAVAGSSLVCIVLLAAAKAHVQNRSYWTTVLSYVSLGVASSGLSYVAGDLFDKLMEKLGLFKSSAEVMIPFLETDLMNTNMMNTNMMNTNMMKPAWSSY